MSVLALAPLAGCTHAAQSVDAATERYTLTLRVEGVRSSSGQLRAELLGRTGGGAPRRITFGVQDAVAGSNVMTFPNLPAGEYAVQLYHDENGNGEVDMNLTGVPLEGYGFSNIPLVQGGIPPFERMKVVVSTDASATAVLAYAP
jgi:uncharacterized protein (DUF2141 family)